MIKVTLLFVATAFCEILGCYLPYLWLKQNKSIWLLFPAAGALVLFVWLLTLHPTAAGRTYAAYGGVYVSISILWLWLVDKISPSVWDIVGVCVALIGMCIIILAPRSIA